jgi:quercetin dioxygenase-like cupin family protein
VTPVLEPGGGETIRPGFQIKVGRPELVMTESIYRPGDKGPDPHVHHEHVDSFFVLDGQLEWRVGPELEPHTGGAGTFVFVPRDVLHTFRNPGPGEARFLNIHAPGLGFERYLRGDFPDFDQHYMPQGSGLAPEGVLVVPAAEGERVELGSSEATIKAGDEQMGAIVATAAPDFPRPPPHRHARTLESIYVIEGQLELELDGQQATVPAGGFAAIAPGTVHSSVASSEPVRIFNVFTPGGLEGFLRDRDPVGFDIEFV